MFRSDTSVGMLKAIALIAGLAILLWSLGLPSIHTATAAAVSSYSDTLTDSAPNASSDHTITFTTPTGVPNGATTTITFPAGFTIGSVDFTDIDMATSTDFTVAADCTGSEQVGASFSGQNLELVFCFGDGGYISPTGSTTITIGLAATGGDQQISNPGVEGSFEIDVSAGATGALDTGTTHVVIMTAVQVTANVDTVFTFAVAGLGSGVSVNGETTTGTTSSTSIPFGTLTNGNATTSAQQLTVNTNASNGYVVTVQTDGPLESTTGGIIDGFDDGSDSDTPTTWNAPGGDVDLPNTWGHWGFTSDDATTTRDAGDEFNVNEFAAASTSPRVVMSHDGPANGVGVGVGTTTVAYKVQITNLQEAGDDYSTVLTYIATPTF